MSADNWTECPRCEGDFREDYEIGLDGREFYVAYKGQCRACDFVHKFDHSVILTP